jgi:hypothetical protein
MPRIPDLEVAIRAVVAEELAAALAPHKALLGKVSKFLVKAGGRGPGRPPKAVAAKAKKPARRARRGSKTKAAASAAAKFKAGQKVFYKQGRGTFEAKVVRVDAAKGLITVQRNKDGKRVARPAAKLKAA